MVHFGNDWDELLAGEFQKGYYLKLHEFLKSEYRNYMVFPPMNDIYNALRLTAYGTLKAVILGQDPYIHPGEAHGLAFSVNPGVPLPPSLVNIFREAVNDVGCTLPRHGCLTQWAEQGVLLLNTALTVRAGVSNSHRGKGWETFTDRVIGIINNREKPVVFLLWGNNAKAKRTLIDNPRHLVLTAAHPSPLAGGAFSGCRHFSQTNAFLRQNGVKEVDWQIR